MKVYVIWLNPMMYQNLFKTLNIDSKTSELNNNL